MNVIRLKAAVAGYPVGAVIVAGRIDEKGRAWIWQSQGSFRVAAESGSYEPETNELSVAVAMLLNELERVLGRSFLDLPLMAKEELAALVRIQRGGPFRG